MHPVKDNMPAALHPAQTGTNIVTRPAQRRIAGEHPAAFLKIADVMGGLAFTPCAKSVGADAEQILLGPAGKTKSGHGLSSLSRKPKGLADSRKHVPFGNSAGVTLIDGPS